MYSGERKEERTSQIRHSCPTRSVEPWVFTKAGCGEIREERAAQCRAEKKKKRVIRLILYKNEGGCQMSEDTSVVRKENSKDGI